MSQEGIEIMGVKVNAHLHVFLDHLDHEVDRLSQFSLVRCCLIGVGRVAAGEARQVVLILDVDAEHGRRVGGGEGGQRLQAYGKQLTHEIVLIARVLQVDLSVS